MQCLSLYWNDSKNTHHAAISRLTVTTDVSLVGRISKLSQSQSLPTAGLVNQTFNFVLVFMQKVPSDGDLEGSFHLQWKQLMQLLLEVLDQPVHAATAASDSARISQSDPTASRWVMGHLLCFVMNQLFLRGELCKACCVCVCVCFWKMDSCVMTHFLCRPTLPNQVLKFLPEEMQRCWPTDASRSSPKQKHPRREDASSFTLPMHRSVLLLVRLQVAVLYNNQALAFGRTVL